MRNIKNGPFEVMEDLEDALALVVREVRDEHAGDETNRDRR
jgi:hypothetical protein